MARRISAADLDIAIESGSEAALFRWFVASFLFGKRIGQQIAARSWRALVETHGLDSAEKIRATPHAELVRILDEGGYARYDESTARRLVDICTRLVEDYDGGILGLYEASDGRADFERRIRAFRGVGPVTLRIFMREAGPVLFDLPRSREGGARPGRAA
ncbi:DNA methylase [Coralloluteibacterium thermophilus]|uniref:DNA methylase n=1 Tax=Coralloluteibacterium thermophilum TaxID=2707049 RepID=A0ABV9NLT3_9GAMM